MPATMNAALAVCNFGFYRTHAEGGTFWLAALCAIAGTVAASLAGLCVWAAIEAHFLSRRAVRP